MQQKAATVDDVIAALEHFRSRTGVYIHPVDVPNARSFLDGLGLGLGVFGIPWDGEVRSQVHRDRGWEQCAVGPIPQMEEKGTTPRQIIDELIDIEIETLRRSSAAAPGRPLNVGPLYPPKGA
jgi:hypothetical protein